MDCTDLLLICILKGGVMFLTRPDRHISVPHEIDFMAVASYGRGARESTGKVRIDMDLTSEVTGRHVLIVEDIIDTGYTLHFVMSMLQARQPATLRLCALLNKATRREIDIPIDYVGFNIDDKFVFGYGPDLTRSSATCPLWPSPIWTRYERSYAAQPARPLDWPEIVLDLRELLSDSPTAVYLVGGAVRDVYMRRPVKDIDLATGAQHQVSQGDRQSPGGRHLCP
jgi:hypoxanthine phosphoribosyltransferase